jgi:hypothetical protein
LGLFSAIDTLPDTFTDKKNMFFGVGQVCLIILNLPSSLGVTLRIALRAGSLTLGGDCRRTMAPSGNLCGTTQHICSRCSGRDDRSLQADALFGRRVVFAEDPSEAL